MKKYLIQQGFTLVELVIVIILIGILAAGTYLKYPVTTLNLSGQINQIGNDIRYTQTLAMTKGQRYRFVKTSNTTYQIQNNSGAAILSAMGTTTVTLNNGITFGAMTNVPNSLIAFDGLGVPYTTTGAPGTALAATAVITVTGDGQTRMLNVYPVTGYVDVQ